MCVNSENAIEVQGLCKYYNSFALQDVSFQLPSGSILGLKSFRWLERCSCKSRILCS